jgi:hypothetical protein
VGGLHAGLTDAEAQNELATQDGAGQVTVSGLVQRREDMTGPLLASLSYVPIFCGRFSFSCAGFGTVGGEKSRLLEYAERWGNANLRQFWAISGN